MKNYLINRFYNLGTGFKRSNIRLYTKNNQYIQIYQKLKENFFC